MKDCPAAKTMYSQYTLKQRARRIPQVARVTFVDFSKAFDLIRSDQISTHFVTRSLRHPGDELHIVSPWYTHFVTLCTSSPG